VLQQDFALEANLAVFQAEAQLVPFFGELKLELLLEPLIRSISSLICGAMRYFGLSMVSVA
jgi:hypothetical protein